MKHITIDMIFPVFITLITIAGTIGISFAWWKMLKDRFYPGIIALPFLLFALLLLCYAGWMV